MISYEEPPSYEDVIKSDKESDNCDANTFWTYTVIILIFIVMLVVVPIILALTVDKN